MEPVRIAVLGCGYVADLYAATLCAHPELRLIGAFDRVGAHLSDFCSRWKTRAYSSAAELLADSSVEMVLNLTNPRDHFESTYQCLLAGKHVYSEKPLAMTARDARALVDLADQRKVRLAAAPCSLLSDTAQTIWKAIKDGLVGKVRLVYASFEDGLIAPKMSPWNWDNGFKRLWPAKDEFEVGCTYEHAGYQLTWLAAFFGPARKVTSFSSCQIPDKGIPVGTMAPDFTVGCIEYDEGVVARVTCGLVAPRDKALTIIGDDGVISTSNVRHDSGPVFIRQIPAKGRWGKIERLFNSLRQILERALPGVFWPDQDWALRWRLPSTRKIARVMVSKDKPVDFNLGPSEFAFAFRENRVSRLSPALALHITELVEALQHPERSGSPCVIQSTFDPIEPLPWNC